MNIGIVTTWCERGASYVSRMYLDSLSKHTKCFVYARGGEDYDRSPEWNKSYVTYGKIVRNGRAMSINYHDFKRWVHENEIGLVIFNEQHNWLPVLWCKSWGIKAVAYVDYYTEETLPFFDLYDSVICNTHRHMKAMRDVTNSIYIPWGTDVDLFRREDDRVKLEADSPLVFFHSCGVSPERKGTDLVIRAFAKVIEMGGAAKLIVHSQLPLEKKLSHKTMSLVEELVSGGVLELVIESVPAPGLYHLGHVYIYPTYLEGIGLTIAEALSFGLPVIVPNEEPMNEFVNQNSSYLVNVDRRFSRKDGYYWPQCEVQLESLVDSIRYYLENRDLIGDFSSSARKHALERLNWSKNSAMLFHELNSLKIKSRNESLESQCRAYESRKHVLPIFFDSILTLLLRLNRMILR